MPEPVLIIDRVFHARLACVASVSNRVYCAKVRAEPKKKVIPFFFALAPAHFLDELARKRLLRRLMHDRFRLSPKRGNKIEGVVLNRIK